MRIARTLAGLICLGLGVHVLESNGWANQAHLRASGGDPADPCSGNEVKFTCKSADGYMCKIGGLKWEASGNPFFYTNKTTTDTCSNSGKECVKTAYSPAQTGCKETPNPNPGGN